MSDGIVGKVVVITGASSGIGAHLAKSLFQKGAKITIAARRMEELQKVAKDCGEGAKERILIHHCDVTKKEDHESLRDRTLEKFGRIDCWVNNAGTAMTKSVLNLTDEDVDLMISINTKSVLYGMQTIVPYFKERKVGHVINVSSLLGRISMAPFRASYSASKAAMNSLTASLRLDLLNEGFDKVIVALVNPGVVATEFGIHAIGGGPDNRSNPTAQSVEEVVEVIVEMIDHPQAAGVDVYTRSAYRGYISAYYTAEDVRAVEASFASHAAVQKPGSATGHK